MIDYRGIAIAAGWVIDPKTRKWWNPARDDGSRYCDTPRAFRYICEDHVLVPEVTDT